MSGLPQDIKSINTQLAKIHGCAYVDKPWYRLVWPVGETEKRVGTFNDFHGEIFLRQFTGMREVRKYEGPTYQDRWILEKLVFIENPEVWDILGKGSYEPIWVFRTSEGEYQKPYYKAVDFVISMLNRPKAYMNQQMLDAEEEETLQEEEAVEYDRLQQNASMFDEERTIVVPRNYIGRK